MFDHCGVGGGCAHVRPVKAETLLEDARVESREAESEYTACCYEEDEKKL